MNKRLFGGAAAVLLAILTIMSFTAVVADPPPAAAGDSGGVKIGFSLSGGLGFINGGDFNTFIRDWNRYIADYNDFFRTDIMTIDWKEMKSMPDFKGEIFARFGRRLGLGLGLEYIKKSNPGKIAINFASSSREDFDTYYVDFTQTYNVTDLYDQILTVIPLTLNLYYHLPIGRTGDVFINAGPGYYWGTLKTDRTSTLNNDLLLELHHPDGSPWPPHFKGETRIADSDQIHVTSRALGFHFGAGFDFNLSGNIALFGEGFYRLANFKEWEGTDLFRSEFHQKVGWWMESAWEDYSSYDYSESEQLKGRLWHMDVRDSEMNADYCHIGFFENGPDEDSPLVKNIRPAEINLNGFSFRVGIKVFFGL
ncbi:MAG TPA: outer membrane beta-barrel protein [Candidatus Aminicenantes bacterium]|nr:outer membrane beta-barrel protein [Candidatus Aminicenantes bacterium]HPN17175.1 outer membrane beta-barrel protein [Candidatus Aminicenantes bacterium]